MTDIFDEATRLEEQERERLLSQHQNRTQEAPDEEDGIRYCLDCADEIPDARVLAVNAVRCVHCATRREHGRRGLSRAP